MQRPRGVGGGSAPRSRSRAPITVWRGVAGAGLRLLGRRLGGPLLGSDRGSIGGCTHRRAAGKWTISVAPRAALTLRCTVTLLCAGTASAAFAQDTDILNDFRLESLEFRRGQFVTVRERPQPLYDPVPARLGSVEVMPRVSTRAIYDSNIFAVGDATGDLVLRGIADVEANWSLGGFAVGADAEIDRRQYLDFGGQSTLPAFMQTARGHRATRSEEHPNELQSQL